MNIKISESCLLAQLSSCWKCFVLAVQFEGSLGKLTVSSVNNPRKMIDAVVTSRSEDDVSVSRIVCIRNSGLSLPLLGSLWNGIKHNGVLYSLTLPGASDLASHGILVFFRCAEILTPSSLRQPGRTWGGRNLFTG